jgi:hypothetical protein
LVPPVVGSGAWTQNPLEKKIILALNANNPELRSARWIVQGQLDSKSLQKNA